MELLAKNGDSYSSDIDTFTQAFTDVLPIDLLDKVNGIRDRGEGP
jgi:hypothetical protein